ncbi:hypothetical protein D3C86_1760560 [compost metagenome]
MAIEELLYIFHRFAGEQLLIEILGNEFKPDIAGVGFPALVRFTRELEESCNKNAQ